MTLLVSAAELAIHLGTSFDATQTARAEQIITAVSGTVQRYCNRYQLVSVADDEITLRGSYSYELHLPRGPVTAVSSVVVDGTATTDYDLVKDHLIRTSFEDQAPFNRPLVPHWGGPDIVIEVTYTHGLAAVPDEVKAVVFDLASRAYSNPSSVRSTSIDNYSVTFAGELSGSSLALTPDQKVALQHFHIGARSARL